MTIASYTRAISGSLGEARKLLVVKLKATSGGGVVPPSHRTAVLVDDPSRNRLHHVLPHNLYVAASYFSTYKPHRHVWPSFFSSTYKETDRLHERIRDRAVEHRERSGESTPTCHQRVQEVTWMARVLE